MSVYIVFKFDDKTWNWNPVAEFDAEDMDKAMKHLESEPEGRYRIVEVYRDQRVIVVRRTLVEPDPIETPT